MLEYPDRVDVVIPAVTTESSATRPPLDSSTDLHVMPGQLASEGRCLQPQMVPLRLNLLLPLRRLVQEVALQKERLSLPCRTPFQRVA